MKGKRKQMVMSLVGMVFSIVAFPMVASAQTNQNQIILDSVNTSQEYVTQDDAHLMAPAITWRYKSENGNVYRRLYNYTTREWVGDWELC